MSIFILVYNILDIKCLIFAMCGNMCRRPISTLPPVGSTTDFPNIFYTGEENEAVLDILFKEYET